MSSAINTQSIQYFIDKQLPMVFRYKFSNPDKIRSFFPTSLYNGKSEQVMVGKNTHNGQYRSFKISGIHFETQDLLPVRNSTVFQEFPIHLSPIPVAQEGIAIDILEPELSLDDIPALEPVFPQSSHLVNYIDNIVLDVLDSPQPLTVQLINNSLENILIDTLEPEEIRLDVAPSNNTSIDNLDFTQLYINTNLDPVALKDILDFSIPSTPVSQTKCQGCLEDQPNQLAHMEYGGCLYTQW